MSVIIGSPPQGNSGGQWTSGIAGKIGAADYTLLVQANGDGKAHVFKRMSGTIIWTEMDSAHAVLLGINQTYVPLAGGVVQKCCWIDGSKIYMLVLLQHSTAGPNFFIDGWDIFSFNTATDTWDNAGVKISTFANGSGGTTVEISYNAGAVPGSVSQCAIHMIVKGTNNYVFYYSGTSQTISTVKYGRLYRSTFNGTTFAGETQIPGQVGVTDRFWSLGGVYDGTNTHYFGYIDGGVPNKDIFHVGEDGGGFSSSSAVNGGFPTGLYYTGLFPLSTVSRPILYNDNLGNPKIAIVGEFWTEPFDGSQCLGFLNATPAKVPIWTAKVMHSGSDDVAGSFPWHSDNALFPVHQGNNEQCIDINAESGGNLVVAWCTTDETTHKIGHVYYSKSVDGVTWTAGVSILDAANLDADDNPMNSVLVYPDSDSHGISIIGNQESADNFSEESQWAQLTFAPPAPTCSLHATKSTITSGSSTILYWTTTGSPTLGIIDNGVGQVIMPSGSVNVMPIANTTYVLTVSNVNGQSTCQVTITVSNCTLSATYEQDYAFFD